MPAKLISLALVLHLREPSQFHCGNCTSGPSSAIKQGLLHRCLFSLVRTVAIEESVPKKCIAVPHRFIVKMISLSCFGVIVLISIMGINAFVPGDRISTLCQTYHGGVSHGNSYTFIATHAD